MYYYFEVEEEHNVVIAEFLLTQLKDGPTSKKIEAFGDDLRNIAERYGHCLCVLDFKILAYLSSAALNKMIFCQRAFRERGGQLVISGLRSEIREVFYMTRLSQFFTLAESVEEARALAAAT